LLRSLWEKMAPAPDAQVMEKLAGIDFFSHLDDASLRQIARLSVQRSFATGSLVLRQGTVGLGLLLITRGRVEVFVSEAEDRLVVAELGCGAVVGEMALIDEQPRSASAVALEPTEVLLLTREGFRRLLDRHPRIAWSLVPTLVDRLRDLQDRLLRAEGAEPAPVIAAGSGPVSEEPPPAAATARPVVPGRLGVDSVLRLPTAMIASGIVGIAGSINACQEVARTLQDELELEGDRPLADLARSLPQGFWRAGREAFDQGWQLPRRMAGSFFADLRGGADEVDEVDPPAGGRRLDPA